MISARDTKLDAIRAHLTKQNRSQNPKPARKVLPLVRRITFVSPIGSTTPASHPASVLSR